MALINAVEKINDKIPCRLIIAILAFFACFFQYMVRVNMSINILAMVDSPDGNGTINGLDDFGPRYPWTAYEVSLILGAYYWGYTITQIPSGLISDRFNAKSMILVCMIPSFILTAITPPVAQYNVWISFMVRFLIGLFSGTLFPALHRLVAQWAPPAEKGKFIAALLGGSIGTVVTWPLTGLLIENYGWDFAFYIPAILTAIFTILCFFFIYDTPRDHPRITAKEKDYIEGALKGISHNNDWPPLLDLLKSLPFWALLLLHYGSLWGFYFLLTGAPKFMNEVLGFDLSTSGFLSSLPYLARFFTAAAFAQVGDFMRHKKYSVTILRKAFCIISHIIPGILLIALPYFSYDPYICVALISISLGLNGSSNLTNLVNAHDIAPNYAGTIYGIINTVGTTSGFIAPVVVAYFTQERNTVDEWNNIFIIGAVFYILPAIIFMIFGSGEIQLWNDKKRNP